MSSPATSHQDPISIPVAHLGGLPSLSVPLYSAAFAAPDLLLPTPLEPRQQVDSAAPETLLVGRRSGLSRGFEGNVGLTLHQPASSFSTWYPSSSSTSHSSRLTLAPASGPSSVARLFSGSLSTSSVPSSRRSSKSTSSTPSGSRGASVPTSSRRLRRRSFSNGDGARSNPGPPSSSGGHPFSLSVISEHHTPQGSSTWAPSVTSASEQSSPTSPVEYYSVPPPKRRSAPTSPMSSNTTPSSALSFSLLALQLSGSAASQTARHPGSAQAQQVQHDYSATMQVDSPSSKPSRSPSSTFEPLEPGKRKQRSRSHSPDSSPGSDANITDPSAMAVDSDIMPDAGTLPGADSLRRCPLNRATVLILSTFQSVQTTILRHGTGQEGPSGAVTSADSPPGSASAVLQHHSSTAPYYSVRVNEFLQNGRYKVLSLLGRGSFGLVVRAEIVDESAPPQTEVAIKILRKGASFLSQGKREWQVLQYIRKHQASSDESQNFVVNALDCFFQDDHFCIVFELLSDTLYELLQRSWAMATSGGDAGPRAGLSLRMVCKMTHQLLCALVTLRGLRIIHADLKPENVALTSPNRPRIKLLDFGSCCFSSEEASNQFPYIQSRYYRAPEVLLGSGYGCEIDMWSLGCVVVELFLGKPLFIGENTIQQLYKIIDLIDAPPDSTIRRSAHWARFFKKSSTHLGSSTSVYGIAGVERTCHYEPKRSSVRALISSKTEANQPQHLEYFIDFVERILKWDPSSRMTPLDALNHNFILHGPRGPAPPR